MTFLETQQAESQSNSHAKQSFVDRLQSYAKPATQLLKDRPIVGVGLIFGAGVVLGATLFSGIGRVAALGIAGIGMEILKRKIAAGAFDAVQPA